MIVTYEALNKDGVLVSDSLAVDDIAQARGELSRRGLTPVAIRESRGRGAQHTPSWLTRLSVSGREVKADPNKAARSELPFFTTQLAILLETGTPVAPSLAAIEKQVRSPHWKRVVWQLSRHVEEGGTLASAVALYPRLFDPVFVSMISAGEASGKLSYILNRLAELARQAARLRSRIQSALIYPSLLVTIATAVLTVLIFFVLPRFAAIFDEMQVTLPGSTRALLMLSATIREQLLLTVLVLGGLVVAAVYFLKSVPGKRFIARNSLKLPVFGNLISSVITARIFRLIGVLVDSSVPLVDALNLTRNATGHYLFVDMLRRVHENVLVGQPMVEAIQESDLVSPSITQMVETGEQNGQIGRVMNLLADYLDDQNDTTIGTLTSIMEPMILIFMGLIIGVIAISLVLPMFDLAQISG